MTVADDIIEEILDALRRGASAETGSDLQQRIDTESLADLVTLFETGDPLLLTFEGIPIILIDDSSVIGRSSEPLDEASCPDRTAGQLPPSVTTASDRAGLIVRTAVDVIDAMLPADEIVFLQSRGSFLIPAASSVDTSAAFDRVIPVDTSSTGRSFSEGTSMLLTAEDSPDETASDGTAQLPAPILDGRHQSVVSAPLDELGALVALSTATDRFDDGHVTILSAAAQTLTPLLTRGQPGVLDHEPARQYIAELLRHDVANKLTTAYGRLELISGSDNTRHRQAITSALEEIESTCALASRWAETSSPIEQLREIDLEEAIRSVVETHSGSPIELDVRDPPTVLADRECLERILDNAVRNAIVHAPGPVVVSVGALDDGFYIGDDGPGIPASQRDTVFESGVTSSNGRSGVGLTIVRELAEAHGWTVSIDESDAGGTNLEFRGVVLRE